MANSIERMIADTFMEMAQGLADDELSVECIHCLFDADALGHFA